VRRRSWVPKRSMPICLAACSTTDQIAQSLNPRRSGRPCRGGRRSPSAPPSFGSPSIYTPGKDSCRIVTLVSWVNYCFFSPFGPGPFATRSQCSSAPRRSAKNALPYVCEKEPAPQK
jgi:hypothetical protein